MKRLFGLSAIVSSIVITVLLVGIQRFGVFQTFELRIFDQMMQMRGDSQPDSRLLIVAVTEEDIRKYGHPLSGQVLDSLLAKLIEYEPRAIGLDIYRDLPVEPGHNQLLERLQLDDLIVPICEHSESGKPAIPPPTGIEPERVGFNDVVEDPDGTIRRNLLFLDPAKNDPCQADFSFSLQLALKYLAVGDIQPEFNSVGDLQLRDVVFKPLESNFGAYQNIDAGGYQILLNYGSKQIAQQVTVTDVLTNQVSQDQVGDRIVLIGSTAPSLKDIQQTPYSSGKSDNSGDMAGVVIHANSVSQILSTVLNGKPLFWSLPEWSEVGWILIWSLAGGIIALRFGHPVLLAIAGVGSLAVLFGGNFVMFILGGWIPVVTPALGLILAGGSVTAYIGYQNKLEKERIEQHLKERDDAIAQLQNSLKATKSPSNEETDIIYPIGEVLPDGTVLDNRYKITKNLSSGGFGRTYLAEDTRRPGFPTCVVKQFKPPQQDEKLLKLLKRAFDTEAKVLEDLGKEHNQIPQLLAYFEEKGQFYLVQEYIKGQPLDKEIFPGKRLEESQVVQLLKEVLPILVFIHERNIIHADIKPSNLIRRESDGKIVLIDFGAVKVIQSFQTENLSFESQEGQELRFITRGYAPPEQCQGNLQFCSDIYALGIVAIQALTGVDPKNVRPGQNNAIEIKKSQPNESLQNWRNVVQVNEKLAVVLEKMVDIDFTLRYQSAKEVLDGLKGL